MNRGYSQTPRLLKGALIYFGAAMLVPIPNIIVFQYNPESMTRSLNPWQPLTPITGKKQEKDPVTGQMVMTQAEAEYQSKLRALAQPYDPEETFSLVLEMDASDALETPDKHPVAALTGIADRLAAIEMLMYPPGDNTLTLLSQAGITVSASVSVGPLSASIGGAGGALAAVDRKEAPVVLFFWGPGRIVPVKIMSLSIEEQQFSPTLYPLRAKATIGLRVLEPADLVMLDGNPATGAAVTIAKAAYIFTRAQKEALATANLLNAAESMGIPLPF